MMEAKASLTSEILSNLPTGKIEAFFKYVRETVTNLPTDAELKKVLTEQYKRFTNYVESSINLPAPPVVMSKDEVAGLREYGQKYPAFQGIMEEIIQDGNDFLEAEIHQRFCQMLRNPDNFEGAVKESIMPDINLDTFPNASNAYEIDPDLELPPIPEAT